MCTANKGKQHVFVSHVWKLEGKEVKIINRWEKELRLLESRTLPCFFPHTAFMNSVCVSVFVEYTSLKCNAFLDTGKEANRYSASKKSWILRDNNFFFCWKGVSRNLHENILCHVVYNLSSLAQMRESRIEFGLISLTWTEEKYFQPLGPHLCLTFLFWLVIPTFNPILALSKSNES